MTRPDALRLAEKLERAKKWGCPADVIQSSADELRRLAVVEAQRNALLKALRHAVTLLRNNVDPEDLDGERFDLTDCADMKKIFATIAAVEGEKDRGDWPICHHCGQMMFPEPLRRDHE